MKSQPPVFKIKSDRYLVSIFFRSQKRIQQLVERFFPAFSFSWKMSFNIGKAIRTDRQINERLKLFSKHCPFSKINLSELFSKEDRESIFRKAEDILQHQIDLLGSGPVSLGYPIKWHCDFVTGFLWDPQKRYNETAKIKPEGSDIKRPWELSRFQHVIPLALAWKLSENEERYVDEFIHQIQDWIKQNPVGYGVNWACPMDVAIRSINWAVGYAIFHDLLKRDNYAIFRKQLTISLWEHARFIETHLEWNGPLSERRANHFLADIAGLFTLGILFSDTKYGRRWLQFSRKWLENEISRQVLDDGVHFECSTSYHRLCSDFFLWCYHLGKENDVNFSDAYRDRLNAMRHFARAYARPDGTSPLFGDNDDGRLFSTGIDPINNHQYLYIKPPKGASAIQATLLSGDDQYSLDSVYGLSIFKNAGFYVINSPDIHLIIRAGRIAHLGMHAHCDQLSFELSIMNDPVFVDRGTFVYTSYPEQRKIYRSTYAHNVLTVNGAEQNRAMGRISRLLDDTNTQVLIADQQRILAKHSGFKSLGRADIVHTREFLYKENDKTIEIKDKIEGVKEGDAVEWLFHFASDLKIDCSPAFVEIRNEHKSLCRIKTNPKIEARTMRFDHSPSYGRLNEAYTLIFKKDITKNCTEYNACFQIMWKE